MNNKVSNSLLRKVLLWVIDIHFRAIQVGIKGFDFGEIETPTQEELLKKELQITLEIHSSLM